MAPELAVPGKSTAVFVTLNGPASLQPLNVTLKLFPDPSVVSDTPVQPLSETTQEIRGRLTFVDDNLPLLFPFLN